MVFILGMAKDPVPYSGAIGDSRIQTELSWVEGMAPGPSCSGWASPLLRPRPQVQLEGPGVARLRVQVPVVVGDVLGIEDAVLLLARVGLGEAAADELGVDGAVDHDVGDVDVLRPQLARHALRQRA